MSDTSSQTLSRNKDKTPVQLEHINPNDNTVVISTLRHPTSSDTNNIVEAKDQDF